jgi:hypothetical protein
MHNPYGKYFTSFAAVKKQMKIYSTEACSHPARFAFQKIGSVNNLILCKKISSNSYLKGKWVGYNTFLKHIKSNCSSLWLVPVLGNMVAQPQVIHDHMKGIIFYWR